MTTPLVKPTSIVEPFAINGQKNTIPVTKVTAGQASLDQGFPAETLTAVSLGGVPPSGKDFNGLFNWITSHLAWLNGGGRYTFDATLSTFIGGYPVGMVLQSNDGLSSYVNVSAGNTTDFNSTPSAIGTSWLPWGGAAVSPSSVTAISTTGGTTTLTGAQAARRVIAVTGALTSNANIIVPNNGTQSWVVINATTGAFTVNCAPSGGSAVSITRGARDIIVSDGATMSYGQADTTTATAGDNSTLIANTAFVSGAISTVTAAYIAAIAAALVNTNLTGTPTAPTVTAGDSTTKIATTAFTATAIANALVNTALTGTPTAPTPTSSDNTTKIATTAFTVTSTANAIAAALVNTALTGTPTAPTPASSDNTTKIATMAALQTAVAGASINSVPQYKSANFTAGVTGEYWIDTTGGAFTMTLPDPPTNQNLIKIVDLGGNLFNAPMTINAGTKTILGSASNLVCDVSGEEFKIWYNGSDWRLE